MSRADQGLIAAIALVLLVLAGFGGVATWVGKVQAECWQGEQTK